MSCNCTLSASVPNLQNDAPMRTRFDLAAICEDWATHAEEIANSILARLNQYDLEAQSRQRARANLLQQEALHFKDYAERLRGKHQDPPQAHA